MDNSNILTRHRQGGFTLIELVMGLLISGIILLAVATLSYAMRQGQEVTDQMLANQSMNRSLSIRIPEMIRNSLAVWQADDGDLVIWTEDANANRHVETSELAYLMINTAGRRIELMTCAGLNVPVTIAQILDGTAESTIKATPIEQIIPLVTRCTNMQFQIQNEKFVIIQFQLTEETGSRDYQVCACVRGDASAWIQGGVLVSIDDD